MPNNGLRDAAVLLLSWFCGVKFQKGPSVRPDSPLRERNSGKSVTGSGPGLCARGTSGAVPAVLWLLGWASPETSMLETARRPFGGTLLRSLLEARRRAMRILEFGGI